MIRYHTSAGLVAVLNIFLLYSSLTPYPAKTDKRPFAFFSLFHTPIRGYQDAFHPRAEAIPPVPNNVTISPFVRCSKRDILSNARSL